MKYLSEVDKPPIGSIIINHHAGEKNPNRIGILIGYTFVAPNRCMKFINSKGTMYRVIRDESSKMQVIGKTDFAATILNAEYSNQIIESFHPLT